MTYPHIVWFKRDLRVHDHAALWAAYKSNAPVVGLYVIEPAYWAQPDTGHVQFEVFKQSVLDLKRSLKAVGIPLLIRKGDMVQVLDQVHEELKFSHVWSHMETGGEMTYMRDLAVGKWSKEKGVFWKEFRQHGVERPNRGRDGWSKRWRALMEEEMVPAIEDYQIWKLPQGVSVGRMPSRRSLGIEEDVKPEAMRGGETLALEVLDSFLRVRSKEYRTRMSSPVEAFDGCSRLSHHLATGAISQRHVYQSIKARVGELRELPDTGGWRQSLRSFEGRLAWHCHFMQKFEDEPELEFRNMNRAFDGVRQEDPEQWTDEERARFEAWREGKTGMPMVDACMRALHQGGWINFRMRAMLMSTASYHLWLHWRPTAVYMGTQFIDLEVGIHYTQAQMQSGVTGINTMRIYSPRKQVKDQDPEGEFIKKYVPELKHVPKEHLGEPFRMSQQEQRQSKCVIGQDYPYPLVDESESRKHALAKMWAVKKTAYAKEESARVLAKHGSRSTRLHKKKKAKKASAKKNVA